MDIACHLKIRLFHLEFSKFLRKLLLNRFYHFIGEDGSTAQYSPDVISNEDTPQIEIEIKGHAKRYKAKPDYWLDHIRLKQIQSTYDSISNIDMK